MGYIEGFVLWPFCIIYVFSLYGLGFGAIQRALKGAVLPWLSLEGSLTASYKDVGKLIWKFFGHWIRICKVFECALWFFCHCCTPNSENSQQFSTRKVSNERFSLNLLILRKKMYIWNCLKNFICCHFFFKFCFMRTC